MQLSAVLDIQSKIDKTQDDNLINACRYKFIQTILDQYQRSFTVLDIGVAQRGYFSLKTASDYDAVCVMIKTNKAHTYLHDSNDLLDVCKARTDLENIVLLNKPFTPNDLQHLNDCEDFDIVLALDIIREYGNQWQQILSTIAHMGSWVIVEVSPGNPAVESFIIAKGGVLLGRVPKVDSTLYMFRSTQKYLRRKTWLRSIIKEDLYLIESSFTHKKLFKPVSSKEKTLQENPWIPGINLVTFKMCNGVYPTKEIVKEKLLHIKNDSHSDWLINNMIVQGSKIVTIDGNDQSSKVFFSNALFQAHQELLDLENPQQIHHYFWQKLVKVSTSKRQVIKFLSQLFPPSSLVFNLGLRDKVVIDSYLGYGAKIIYFDSNEKEEYELYKRYRQEAFILASNESSSLQKVNSGQLVDHMASQHGAPQFCIIHQTLEPMHEVLRSISTPISCIAFKFEMRHQPDLRISLEYLVSRGYRVFNFSARNLASFALEPDKFTGTNKNWVSSVAELFSELNEFAQLDHDGERLWGYIYAKRD